MITRRVRHLRSAQTLQRSAAAGRGATSIKRTGKCIIFSNFIEAIDSVSNSLSEALLQYGPHPRNCADGGACNFMRFTANMKDGMQERIAALKLFRLPRVQKYNNWRRSWYNSTTADAATRAGRHAPDISILLLDASTKVQILTQLLVQQYQN